MSIRKKDYYYKKAKKEKYNARSVFKLEEIDHKYNIFSKGNNVLDLGASPGSWSQYVSKKIGNDGKILGIDLNPVNLTLTNALFIEGDIFEVDIQKIAKENKIPPIFDIVLSDMAPKTTGIRFRDQALSYELCTKALKIADHHLTEKGGFICKFFHSEEFRKFSEEMKSYFKKVEVFKPKSTRQESKEIFFIGLDHKKPKGDN